MVTVINFVDEEFREITGEGELLHQLVVSLNVASALFHDVSRENVFGVVNSHTKMFAGFHQGQRAMAKGETKCFFFYFSLKKRLSN